MRDEDILKYVPRGRKNARSRHIIAKEAGVSERVFRDMVNRLNRQSDHDLIIADQNRGGYFLPKFPEDEEYCNAYINQTFSRANKEKTKALALKRKLKKQMERHREMPGQLTLDLEGGTNG